MILTTHHFLSINLSIKKINHIAKCVLYSINYFFSTRTKISKKKMHQLETLIFLFTQRKLKSSKFCI